LVIDKEFSFSVKNLTNIDTNLINEIIYVRKLAPMSKTRKKINFSKTKIYKILTKIKRKKKEREKITRLRR